MSAPTCQRVVSLARTSPILAACLPRTQVTCGLQTGLVEAVSEAVAAVLADAGVRANIIVSGHGDWRWEAGGGSGCQQGWWRQEEAALPTCFFNHPTPFLLCPFLSSYHPVHCCPFPLLHSLSSLFPPPPAPIILSVFTVARLHSPSAPDPHPHVLRVPLQQPRPPCNQAAHAHTAMCCKLLWRHIAHLDTL